MIRPAGAGCVLRDFRDVQHGTERGRLDHGHQPSPGLARLAACAVVALPRSGRDVRLAGLHVGLQADRARSRLARRPTHPDDAHLHRDLRQRRTAFDRRVAAIPVLPVGDRALDLLLDDAHADVGNAGRQRESPRQGLLSPAGHSGLDRGFESRVVRDPVRDLPGGSRLLCARGRAGACHHLDSGRALVSAAPRRLRTRRRNRCRRADDAVSRPEPAGDLWRAAGDVRHAGDLSAVHGAGAVSVAGASQSAVAGDRSMPIGFSRHRYR